MLIEDTNGAGGWRKKELADCISIEM